MVRIRQIVTAVQDLETSAASAVEAGLPFVFQDPAVAEFGAVNSLHRASDTFVELLAERDPGSPVGRHLARLGRDGGYMVIVQVDELDAALDRASTAEVRTIFDARGPGIRGVHLHPADVGSAILSIDHADPSESWAWCGPEWTGGAPAIDDTAPITSISLTATDPAATAQRWAAVLDVAVDGAILELDGGTIAFTEPVDDGPDRLVAARIPGIADTTVGGLALVG